MMGTWPDHDVEAPAQQKGSNHARDAAAVSVVMTTCILLGATSLVWHRCPAVLHCKPAAHKFGSPPLPPCAVPHRACGRHAGDMLGLGSLTLPSAFARLGWVFALVLMGLCCAGTLYSGRLFTMLTLQVRRCLLITSAAAGTGVTDTVYASAAPGERHCSGAPVRCSCHSSSSHAVA